MPILDIELVGPGPDDGDGLASRLADAAAAVFESPPRGAWVKLRYLDPACYAESGGAEPGVRPVFVSVLRRANPTGDALRDEVAALTRAIATACERPADNVHVLYGAPAAGRLAFGGSLVA